MPLFLNVWRVGREGFPLFPTFCDRFRQIERLALYRALSLNLFYCGHPGSQFVKISPGRAPHIIDRRISRREAPIFFLEVPQLLVVAVLSAALVLPTFLLCRHSLSFAQQFDCCLVRPFVSACL